MHLTLILDTSFSMNQKTYMGLTYMDIAKTIVDNFLKTRPIDVEGKYYVEKVQIFTTQLSSNDISFTLLSANNDTIADLHRKFKYIKPSGPRNLAKTVFDVFRFMDLYRISTGIDSICMGRFPFFNEQNIILLISCDLVGNEQLSSVINKEDIETNLKKVLIDVAGQSSFYFQPYRWDQRFYVIDIASPGIIYLENDCKNYRYENNSMKENILYNIAIETNGQWVPVYNEATLSNICFTLKAASYQQDANIPIWLIDMSLYESYMEQFGDDILKFNSISTLNYFKSLKEDKNGYRVELIVPNGSLTSNYYPIPEEYYPNHLNNQEIIPLRDCSPVVVFSELAVTRPICNELPIDQYQIEAQHLPECILDQLDSVLKCIPCYIINSGDKKNTIGDSFGYFALNKDSGNINFYILPYNYFVLVPLLNDWMAARGRITKNWMESFESYLRSIPFYYLHPIRNALKKVGIPVAHFLPDINELQFNRRADHLLRNGKPLAKKIFDTINLGFTSSTSSDLIINYGLIVNSDRFFYNIPPTVVSNRTDFRTLLLKQRPPKYNQIDMENFLFPPIDDIQLNMYHNGKKPEKDDCINQFLNPYSINRNDLLTLLPDLYNNICKSSFNKVKPQLKESIHSVSIDMMGNYRTKDVDNLRPVDPTQVRTHSFGNPFKTRQMDYDVKVDEAIDQSAFDSNASNRIIKDPSQFRKQREYRNRRRKFLSQRVGRIRRSLSQSFLDSLENLEGSDSIINEFPNKTNSFSTIDFDVNSNDGSDGIYDNYNNKSTIIDTSCSKTSVNSHSIDSHMLIGSSDKNVSSSKCNLSGKTFMNAIKRLIHLLRMHIINLKLIEKFVRENYNRYNQKLFVHYIKTESSKYKRWKLIKPIVERYINIENDM